jgi:hypothetical protein
MTPKHMTRPCFEDRNRDHQSIQENNTDTVASAICSDGRSVNSRRASLHAGLKHPFAALTPKPGRELTDPIFTQPDAFCRAPRGAQHHPESGRGSSVV